MGRKSTEKQRKQRQEKIEQWMVDLLPKLQAYEPQKLTMDQLAALIGKRKSTIYEYFSSKEEVLLCATQIRVKTLMAYKEVVDFNNTDIKSTYTLLMELICIGVKDISVVFLNDIESHFPMAWQEVQGFMDTVLADLSLIYSKGIKNRQFRSVPTSLLIALDQYFVTQMITNKSYFKENNITLDHLVREYLELRLFGLQIVPTPS